MLVPPKTFRQRLKYLGPGFILSVAIVGSGELVATKAFFVLYSTLLPLQPVSYEFLATPLGNWVG